MLDKKLLETVCYELIKKAETVLPQSVFERLKTARQKESSKIGRIILDSLIKNAELAKELGRPICQDTGILLFFVEVPREYTSELPVIENSITNAFIKASREFLRPNLVDPLTRRQMTISQYPYVDFKFADLEEVRISVLVKGGGSENVTSLFMLKPTSTLDELKKKVQESIKSIGGKACPPNVVGIGIGGSASYALKLSNKALLRALTCAESKLEKEILAEINKTGVGPMGLGGRVTALSVKIMQSMCHVSTLPFAISVNCWALRRATAVIHRDSTVTYE